MEYSISLLTRGIATLLVIGSALTLSGACASQRAVPEPTPGPVTQEHYEVSCEFALVHLERLIAMRSQDPHFPQAVLLEAKELHQLGKELYLEQEFALALELIEEGIKLVEEESN